jgi:16S rRNA (guanine966-N2)-methyltransferase
MRVIAGSAKGVALQPVPGSGTRPISDRVKVAVFDILGDLLVGSHVLDLFAGTGSVGIEALSRGAEQAVFVEKHPKAVATLRANLKRTKLQDRARVVQVDVFRFLAGSDGCMDSTFAPFTHKMIGARSRCSSNGTLASTATLMAFAAPPMRML